MGRADGRLLLEVVRRQIVVVRGGQVFIKTPALGEASVQQVTVADGKGRLPCGGKGQGRGAGRGYKPHEPRRLARRPGGKGHQQHAQHHAGEHGAHMLGKGGGGAHLGKGGPL